MWIVAKIKTNELGKDVKSGFRAIVEGIKEGNEEMNPKEREKTQIKGFKKLPKSIQNKLKIWEVGNTAKY